MAEVIPLKGSKCPMCSKPASAEHLPFCSKRCRDLDLGKWLNEDYRIASEDEPDQEGFDEER